MTRTLTACLMLLAATAAYAAPSPQGTYTEHTWPASGNYNLDAFVTIEAVDGAAGYFWAHQFALQNAPGGYVGLQNQGYLFDGTRSKLAIFSVWDAVAASGPSCEPFSGEGSGYSCRVPYPWMLGRQYRLRIWAVSEDSEGRWWGAWVQDLTTQQKTYVGQILVPNADAWLDSKSVTWTEYFDGPLQSCGAQPYARARWSEPRANNGAILPATTSSHVSATAGCSNGKVSPSGSGVTHEMGLGGACTPSCGCGGAPDGCGGVCSQPCPQGTPDGGAPDGCFRPPCEAPGPPAPDAGAWGGAKQDLPPLYEAPDGSTGSCSVAPTGPTGTAPLALLLLALTALLRPRRR